MPHRLVKRRRAIRLDSRNWNVLAEQHAHRFNIPAFCCLDKAQVTATRCESRRKQHPGDTGYFQEFHAVWPQVYYMLNQPGFFHAKPLKLSWTLQIAILG
jgi:hypothetical protein